jgi:hypothetical protein
LSENDLHSYFSYYVRKYHEVYAQWTLKKETWFG